MPLIDQSQAFELASPHFAALYDIPHEAWDTYHRDTPSRLLVSYSQRTRASAVHDLIVTGAECYAASGKANGGLRTFERQLMRGIVIANTLAIRIKKLNEDSLSRSQITGQVAQFREQIPLEGLGAVHNLEWGYVINEAQTDIVEIRLVCPSGDGVYWAMRIDGRGASFDTVDIFTPQVSPAPIPPKIGPKRDAIVIPIRKKDT